MKRDETREPPCEADDATRKNRQDDLRQKAAMRTRGWLKLALFTIVANQILTSLFAYGAQQIDAELTLIPILVFSCASCALVSYWLQEDARRAWHYALENGYVGSGRPRSARDELPIAGNCPKRWLVTLHLELNPDLVRTL